MIILLIAPLIVLCQNRDNNYIAKKQIKELHDGILLVKLSTYQAKINAMETAGRYEEAKKFQSGIIKMNDDLVKAFADNFKFCPVYFFFSENADEIKNKKFEGVVLDASLKALEAKLITGKNFFIAEIGKTESDTTLLNDHLNYHYKDSAGMQTGKTYYQGSNISYLALLIRSDQFIQLQKPFPAYIKFKSYDQVPVKTEKINTAVIKLNKELSAFYKEQN